MAEIDRRFNGKQFEKGLAEWAPVQGWLDGFIFVVRRTHASTVGRGFRPWRVDMLGGSVVRVAPPAHGAWSFKFAR